MAYDFLTAEFWEKLSKLGEKKLGATDQPHYNGFHVIRDHIITTLLCIIIESYISIIAYIFFECYHY